MIYSDPSGRFSLGELSISQSIGNTIDRISHSRSANYIRRAFANKISDVYMVTTHTVRGLPSHWFIYVNHDKGNIGFRFDVGVEDVKSFLKRGWRKYIDVFDGYLAFRPDSLARVRLKAIKMFMIARFNKAQEALWTGVMGISMTFDKTQVTYSVPGYAETLNCYKWTEIAPASAFAIQYLPIK